jgi:proteasome lid subunit RPN8/RPN11
MVKMEKRMTVVFGRLLNQSGESKTLATITQTLIFMQQLTPDQSILEQIRDLCIEDYPEECCGIVGDEKVRKSKNVAVDTKNEFTIEPQVWASVKKVDFFWHSHTDDSDLSFQDIQSSLTLKTPVYLFSLPIGKEYYFQPGYLQPLEGRDFVYWAADCWTVARDWYKLNWGIEVYDHPRELKDSEGVYYWDTEGWDAYQQELPQMFDKLPRDEPMVRGDLVLMTMRSNSPTTVTTPNHVAVLDNEEKNELIHHLLGEKSRRVVYGAELRDRTHSVWRLRKNVSESTVNGGNG